MSTCANCGKELPSWKRVMESGLCAECAGRETKQRKETRRSKQNVSSKAVVAVLTVTIGIIGIYARHAATQRKLDALRRQAQQHPWRNHGKPDTRDWREQMEERRLERMLRDAQKQPQQQQRPPWPHFQRPEAPWPGDIADLADVASDRPSEPLPPAEQPGAGTPAAQPPVAELIKKEFEKLAGTWQCVFGVDDGERVPEEQVKEFTCVQDAEGNYKFLLEEEVLGQGKYTEVDPTTTPTTFGGEDDEGKFVGIYRTDGDTWEECSADADQARPTEFTSKPGSGHTHEVWKRVVPLKDMEAIAGRPPARRVARRAMVLALVMYRSSLEQFPGQAKYEALHGRLPAWIDRVGLDLELEKEERDYLRVPLGKADEQVDANASWRHEGLAVLAWALKQYELPLHDEAVDPRKAAASVGFSEELLAAMDTTAAEKLLRDARLRPASEIDRFASHITIVNWRLRNFRLAQLSPTPLEPTDPEQFPFGRGIGERMDFAGFLRVHPSFQETWLEGLRLVDGDLAIGEKSIDAVPAEKVRECGSMAVERQTAAYWLQGDDPIYSDVDPATILSALADEAKAAGTRKALKQKLLEEHQAEVMEAYSRGVEHLEQGEHEKAIAEFTEAIRVYPIFAEAYTNRAVAHFARGEHDAAVADYTKAIELDPQDCVALFGRGQIYVIKREYDDAIADFSEALRLDPEDSKARSRRGYAHLFKKEYEKAAADLTEAIRLDPENADACDNLAWLRATCPQAELRDGKQALEYAQKARELSASEEPARFQTLAAAYAELGQYDEAVKWLNKALASPDDLSEEGLKKARLQLELYEKRQPYRDE